MDTLFLLRLVLTFFTGTIWIYFSISIGKKFGSKISGFIAGLPSTALLSFFFIGYSQSPHIASSAATIFPLSYAMTGMFLVIYAKYVEKGLYFALSAGLSIWFSGALILAILKPSNYLLNLLLYLIILILLVSSLKKISGSGSNINEKIIYSSSQITIRSLFGGLLITLAVLLSKIGGPVFGGIFAAFPAMFISTLAISYRSYGMRFSKALTKPLLLTGMITIVIFSIGVRYFYVLFGLYLGTILSVFLSSISAFLTLAFIQKKIR